MKKHEASLHDSAIDKVPLRYMNTVSFFHFTSKAPKKDVDRGLSWGTSPSGIWKTDGRKEAESKMEWLGGLISS